MKKFLLLVAISSLSLGNAVKADCQAPNDYFYEENLYLGLEKAFFGMSPPNLLYSYLSTSDTIDEYRSSGKPKFFPDGEIVLYVPNSYMTNAINQYKSGLNYQSQLDIHTFPAFKRDVLRNGYVPGYMINDSFTKGFNQEFNTYHEPSFVSSENLGTIVNESFSFLTMGITTHNLDGEEIKYARAAGAIFQYRDEALTLILMSKKLNNQYTQSDIQRAHTEFQNSHQNIIDCLYLPNAGQSFEKTYPETTYKVEPQKESQPAQVESTEPIDYIEKLKEIKSLLDAGIINIDDFEKMKQKVIDNM
jgi:hypothetical protein